MNMLQMNKLFIPLFSTHSFYLLDRFNCRYILIIYFIIFVFKMELQPSCYNVSFIGKKSADLWDCLQMKTCSVNVTKSKNNTCLCTRKLCAKSRCSVLQKDCNQLTVTCKMDTVPAHHDNCLNSSVTDELTGKRTQRTRCTFMNS